jgi:peptidoglycan/LPS O-acetylase OafA/YrhL
MFAYVFKSFYKGSVSSLPWIFSIGIWVWVLLTIILKRLGEASKSKASLTSKILSNKILLNLGRISYSIYLSHKIIIFIFLILFDSFINKIGAWNSFLIEIILIIPSTIFVSNYLNKYIENPGIEIDKRLDLKLQ